MDGNQVIHLTLLSGEQIAVRRDTIKSVRSAGYPAGGGSIVHLGDVSVRETCDHIASLLPKGDSLKQTLIKEKAEILKRQLSQASA